MMWSSKNVISHNQVNISKLDGKTSQALINSKHVKGLLLLFSSIYLFECSANTNRPLSLLSFSLSLATADGPTAQHHNQRIAAAQYTLSPDSLRSGLYNTSRSLLLPSPFWPMLSSTSPHGQLPTTHAMEAFASFADADNQFRRHRTTESATQRHGSVWALMRCKNCCTSAQTLQGMQIASGVLGKRQESNIRNRWGGWQVPTRRTQQSIVIISRGRAKNASKQ